MLHRLFVILTIASFAPLASAAEVDGLIKKKSPHSVSQTIDRLEKALATKGIAVVARWPHSAKAKAVGIEMRDTELLIFGNPKLGSHVMTSAQSAAIDFPMKALAWKDADGKVWLAYNDPGYLASRHSVKDRDEVLKKMSAALDGLTNAAIAK